MQCAVGSCMFLCHGTDNHESGRPLWVISFRSDHDARVNLEVQAVRPGATNFTFLAEALMLCIWCRWAAHTCLLHGEIAGAEERLWTATALSS